MLRNGTTDGRDDAFSHMQAALRLRGEIKEEEECAYVCSSCWGFHVKVSPTHRGIDCVPHQPKMRLLAHYEDDAPIPLIGVQFVPSNQTRAV